MLKLYKFQWSFHRMGVISSIFVADDKEIELAIGNFINMGEALGKHSEICGTLEEENFTVLTEDQDFIEKFQIYGCETGKNPLKYLEHEEE